MSGISGLCADTGLVIVTSGQSASPSRGLSVGLALANFIPNFSPFLLSVHLPIFCEQHCEVQLAKSSIALTEWCDVNMGRQSCGKSSDSQTELGELIGAILLEEAGIDAELVNAIFGTTMSPDPCFSRK
jgi:hypothetical protein